MPMREEGVWEVSGARQEKMDGEEVVFENLPIGWVNFVFINTALLARKGVTFNLT